MTYTSYVKTHWGLYNRKVRFYVVGKKIRLAILYTRRLGLVLKHEFTDLIEAINVAEKIEAKSLINTACWNKIYYPYRYKMWNGNHATLSTINVE